MEALKTFNSRLYEVKVEFVRPDRQIVHKQDYYVADSMVNAITMAEAAIGRPYKVTSAELVSDSIACQRPMGDEQK